VLHHLDPGGDIIDEAKFRRSIRNHICAAILWLAGVDPTMLITCRLRVFTLHASAARSDDNTLGQPDFLTIAHSVYQPVESDYPEQYRHLMRKHTDDAVYPSNTMTGLERSPRAGAEVKCPRSMSWTRLVSTSRTFFGVFEKLCGFRLHM